MKELVFFGLGFVLGGGSIGYLAYVYGKKVVTAAQIAQQSVTSIKKAL
jgi:hypothetical protein